MSGINKEWMSELNTVSLRYLTGVSDFIEFVNKNGGGHTRYSCPCKICRNGKGMVSLKTITFHLLKEGIDQSYTVWKFHGENDIVKEKLCTEKSSGKNDEIEHPRMEELVNDAFEMHDFEANDPFVDSIVENTEEGSSDVNVDHGKTKVGKKYKSLYLAASEPLYSSCPDDITTLHAVVKLNSIKTQFGWSDNSVTALLGFLKDLLPVGNKLPTKYSDVKGIIKDVGMDYKTYHACVNDCLIYWKEHENMVSCPHCQAPRYKVSLKPVTSRSKVPQKTLRHFPIIPRLKRLYSVPWMANEMTWHHRADSGPDVMRHPVDASAWQCANTSWPEFASEPRNVHLGLSTDGFNPYGSLSSSYSCWPVIAVPYNLPPSMCMKSEFSMLSLLISGPKAPSKDIDVYLEPLVDELKQLWFEGVIAFDSFKKSNFTLKAMLLWCIHDFPAYGTLSGCITRGYKACPICAEDTFSDHLPHSKNICYMGHRKFLPPKHKFRDDRSNFNKEVEHGVAPWPLSGSEVEQKVAHINMKPGKYKVPVASGRKRKKNSEDAIGDDDVDEAQPSTDIAYYRRSILFDLPYWKEHPVRHNLDVMHIAKNVGEHLLNTILDSSKSKDTNNARKDLKTMGIKPKLWLEEDPVTKKVTKPKASFTLEKEEKQTSCNILKNIKVPTKFSSNLRNNVSLQPPEIKNFKSHDYHVVLQHLLPLLLQHAYPKHKDLQNAIFRISLFFNILCAKVINREHLVKAKKSLIEAICVLEKHFPPAFFDISIHLMVHLADEALACGPVRYRWMYPFERLMKTYKGYARNKRYIEGCIAEGYIVQEASLYCMEYIPHGARGTHKHTREAFLDDEDEYVDEGPLSNGRDLNLTQVQFEQVRKWILNKYDGVDEWQKKYDSYAQAQRSTTTTSTVESFIPWLREELLKENNVNSPIWQLANGPKFKARSYVKYRVNGFVFSPSEYEAHLVTQDSGVSMNAITQCRATVRDTRYKEAIITYYGVIKQIIELDYVDFTQVVFYCDWVKVEDKTHGCKFDPNSHLVMVNFGKMKSKDKVDDEPFILATEASQVFYSEDSKNNGWSLVLHSPKRLTMSVDNTAFPTVYQSAFDDNEKLETLIKSMR